ncbi:hypothetical protein [Sorangium sp. So ce1097]|uniref:hypothetical protein n=1 Tax=Sorangium sp. So ce1097 TaxID=3133330 RepID=UPI003F630E84
MYVRRVARSLAGQVALGGGVLVAVALSPGVMLFAIPPVVVAVTGAFVVPAFVLARHRLLEERRSLAA